MTQRDDHARTARALLAGRLHGVLSTHSLEHEGYPFGTLVPYILGQDGQPLVLLSHLSQHTKNIDADPRCGLVVIEDGDGDVQQFGRLSAVGTLAPCDDPDAERYFRYYPAARDYFEHLGFRFYAFAPLRFHWNGGFATARWFANDRLIRANPLTPEQQLRVITHMNSDHADALRAYLVDSIDLPESATALMVGVDADGIDLRVGDRLYRVGLPREIASPDEAREVLVEMAGS